MLTYATYADYLAMKKINSNDVDAAGQDVIQDYLRRARTYLDKRTHRQFYPYFQQRLLEIPVNYIDLRNRLLIYDELMLDEDLLEAFYVQTTSTQLVNTTETVPAGGLDTIATSFTATDVDGSDGTGNSPRIAAGDVLRINNEYLRVVATNTSTNVVTVARAALGTIASAHAEGDAINKLQMTTFTPGIDYWLLDFNNTPKSSIRLNWPKSWGGDYFAGGSYPGEPVIYITAFWGYHEDYPSEAWINTNDTLQTGVDDSAPSFTVADGDGLDENGDTRFQLGYLYRIDNELFWVTAINTNTLTVTRARHGSLAAAHSSGSRIYRWRVQDDIIEATVSIAKTWRDADNSVGGRQGVSDMSIGVEVELPSGTQDTIGHYMKAEIG